MQTPQKIGVFAIFMYQQFYFLARKRTLNSELTCMLPAKKTPYRITGMECII